MANSQVNSNFLALDLGTGNPIPVPMETVDVTICVDDMVGDYVKGFINETERVAPRLAEREQLTAEELKAYVYYLFTKRLEIVGQKCSDRAKLGNLYIPSFIQWALTLVGEVVIRDRGLTFRPVMNNPSDMTFDEAMRISSKIAAFEDYLVVVNKAMPFDVEGNKEVMTMALIAGYVRALDKASHPVFSYMCAFLGMQIQKESAFQVLYRVQYDDYGFIRQALLHGGVYPRC